MAGTIYRCGTPGRRRQILDPPSGAVLNAIDFLEVIDEVPVAGIPRQRTLLVHLFRDAPTTFVGSNVRIAGGVRVTAIDVLWVARADAVTAPGVDPAEQAFYAGLADSSRILVVRTNVEGDFATYRLSLVEVDGSGEPPAGFDPVLSGVDFGFKVECPSDFDCREEPRCPTAPLEEPAIDYLAKDYQSFRRVMLDRLAVVMPEWRERSPADPLMTVLETLAYVGDHLSYKQDAVATEAYLGTARRRTSVRRHARLLDYRVHEGVSARAWVHLDVTANLPITLGAGVQFLVADAPDPVIAPAEVEALPAPPIVFEPLHAMTCRPAHNEVHFYTWGDEDCCLPLGATRASFLDAGPQPLALAPGDVIILEEAKGPATGLVADADPTRRAAVRLERVFPRVDPFSGAVVIEVEWHVDDALPFPLCLSAQVDGVAVGDVSVARANVILVEHGATVAAEPLPAPSPARRRYRPTLARPDLSHRQEYDDASARRRSARSATAIDPRAAVPAVRLSGPDGPWVARADLLGSTPTASDFMVEMDDDGVARLRFGDGRLGREPPLGGGLTAHYRVGRGTAGNVGRGAICHALVPGLSPASLIAGVRNPMRAGGGAEPEPLSEVKLYAPQAFRRNERAVSADDYRRRAESFPDVQKAAAVRRWTGSWYTMVVVVDRRGGRPLDARFRAELRAHLESYRLAGFDLELEGPVFVPLDLNLVVCVRAGFFQANVRRALLEAFAAGDLPDGRRGFFHPDHLTFGQAIHLSALVAAAMRVPGVEWVDTRDARVRFQRLGAAAAGELDRQALEMGPLEIAQLDNSPSFPENGRLSFDLEGGR